MKKIKDSNYMALFIGFSKMSFEENVLYSHNPQSYPQLSTKINLTIVQSIDEQYQQCQKKY